MTLHDRIKEVLDYNPKDGIFTWLAQYHVTRSGRIAGSLRWHPKMQVYYLQIKLDGAVYLAHRLAFFWMTGKWPPDEIDFIDGNPMNNKWSNLREASRGQNKQNSRCSRNNKTGFKGVVKRTRGGRYEANIFVNGKTIYLGHFVTPELANDAYYAAAQMHFGEFARSA